MKPPDLAGRVIRGYGRVLRSLGEAFLVLGGMAAVSFAVAFPLWWLAVNKRGLYTAMVAGAGLGAAGILAVRRIRSGRRGGPGGGRGGSRSARILSWLVLAVGVYGTGVLLVRSPVLGIPAALALLAAAGVWAFGRSERIDRG